MDALLVDLNNLNINIGRGVRTMEKSGATITTVPDTSTAKAYEETDWFVWDEELERYMADVFQLLCADE